ncbi:MAG: hypothetical protein HC908_11440 [Calothrix sp. SM1_7_51]|nr:hypothetical protein [Calothrix sp. SM1_7_51]
MITNDKELAVAKKQVEQIIESGSQLPEDEKRELQTLLLVIYRYKSFRRK